MAMLGGRAAEAAGIAAEKSFVEIYEISKIIRLFCNVVTTAYVLRISCAIYLSTSSVSSQQGLSGLVHQDCNGVNVNLGKD